MEFRQCDVLTDVVCVNVVRETKHCTMFKRLWRRHKNMVLASIFFFYFGSIVTLSLLQVECVNSLSKPSNTTTEIHNPHEQVEYAVLILSSPKNIHNRVVLRSTWMNFATNIVTENGEKLYKWNYSRNSSNDIPMFIKFYFAIGTKNLNSEDLQNLHIERTRLNDLLLLENLEDSYTNLATKMLQSLKWLNEHLPKLKYVIKCDDDSFVRVDLIIKDLEAFAPEMNAPEISQYVSFKKSSTPKKGLYWGYLDGRARVYLAGKWEEQDWFLCDTYLPYALGGGYVVSNTIVHYIARNIDMLSQYHSEDVSMGVWTSALNINRVHDTRFDTEWKSRGCTHEMIVRHKQNIEEMFAMFRTVIHSHGTKLCPNEKLIRKSYRYKWNVLPSSCCR